MISDEIQERIVLENGYPEGLRGMSTAPYLPVENRYLFFFGKKRYSYIPVALVVKPGKCPCSCWKSSYTISPIGRLGGIGPSDCGTQGQP